MTGVLIEVVNQNLCIGSTQWMIKVPVYLSWKPIDSAPDLPAHSHLQHLVSPGGRECACIPRFRLGPPGTFGSAQGIERAARGIR